tara:strand:- start:2120 stop:3091 length:972 start_codon:yes stop_codon:yes gene_type:complete
MYIEKKKIGNYVYNYLKISARVGDKVKTKTVSYLGKEPMNKSELNKKIKNIPKSKIKKIMEELKNESDKDKEFLNENQLSELKKIKNNFNKKLNLDNEIIEDMFKDFKTFYIYNTNAIEGNTLSLEETNLLLNKNKTPEGKDLREIYDHINEKETFDYILKKKPSINIDLILKLHSMILKNIDQRIGSFRSHNVRVLGASFDPSPAKYVKTDMSILLKWYNKNKTKLHPLILTALFHEKFERIHPFYDGNGRTGRMLSNLILIKNNYPPLIIENSKRIRYYEVLNSGHKADLTKTEINPYKSIVKFFYEELIYTFNKIFDKWG